MNQLGARPRASARRPVLTLAALTAVLALAACGSSSQSGASKSATVKNAAASSSAGGGFELTVGYIGTAGVFTGPEGFAYSKGLLQQWLKPAGVTGIKVAGFANGPLLTAALVGGSLDVGILGDTPALVGRSQGARAQLLNQDSVNLAAWVIARKSITGVGQLAGKNVARQQASYMDRYLQALLAQHGLTGKVRLVAMLQAQSIPALEAGSLDAVAVPAWQALEVVPKGYNVIARSETTPALQGTSLTEASTSALSAHPRLAAVWNAARVKAIRYAQSHAAAYYAFQAKADGVPSAAQARQYLPLSNYPLANYTPGGLKQLQGTLGFLVSEKEAKPFSIKAWEAAGTS